MPVRKLCYILASIVLCACTSKKELQIIPIEDGYAKKNGGIPVEGYYYLEGFKNTKQNFSKLFNDINYKKNYFNTNKLLHFLGDKSDIEFEDGLAYVRSYNYYIRVILDDSYHYKYLCVSSKELIDTYNFLKKNQQSYNVVNKENTSIIKMAYKDITIETLQHFLNIVAYERRQTKDQLGQYTYQLQHKETQAIDCEIIYYNDPEKGLDNVFKIRFP